MPEISTVARAVRQHAADGCKSPLRFGRDAEIIDYAALWQRVLVQTRLLADCGFEPGQRVALSMSNTLETVSSLLAVMHCGGTLIPLFHRPGMRATGKDHARIVSTLRVSRAPLVLTHASDVAVLQLAAADAGANARVHAYEQVAVAQQGLGEQAPAAGVPALIQFSAGSTSEPKGLCLGHAQLVANSRGIIERLGVTQDERLCTWLPLYHDMGLIGGVMTSLMSGCGLTLYPPAEFVRNPLSWIEQASLDRATALQAPQFAYELCLQKAKLQALPPGAYDLSSVRFALNGAEAVDVEVCEQFETFFAAHGLRRHVIQPSYGLAENCVAVSLRAPGTPRLSRHFERGGLSRGRAEIAAQPSAATVTRAGNGHVIAGTRVAVWDAEDRVLPDGQVGELVISGESTARALLQADGQIRPLPEGVRTGDLGVMLDGELYVVGRCKEVVKRAGEAFSPTDVEACVLTELRDTKAAHVLCVGAFGFRHEQTGREEIVIVLETREFRHADRARELSNQVRRTLLREYRLPLHDVVIAKPGVIPRTTSGKLQRLALRDKYLRGELSVSEPSPLQAGG